MRKEKRVTEYAPECVFGPWPLMTLGDFLTGKNIYTPPRPLNLHLMIKHPPRREIDTGAAFNGLFLLHLKELGIGADSFVINSTAWRPLPTSHFRNS